MNSDKHMRVNVSMNTLEITQIFNKIVLLMEAAISNVDMAAYRNFEREAAVMRWYEALEHYLSFTLSHTQGNIGFDYYLNDYFMVHAHLLNNPEFIQPASTLFANAAGIASQALYLACQRMEQHDVVLEEVEYTPDGLQQGHFLLTGIYQSERQPLGLGMNTIVPTPEGYVKGISSQTSSPIY